jgi:hypothetical protein
MNDSQSILVLLSGIFTIIMFVIVMIKGPLITPLSKAKFSTEELPKLIKLIIGVVCVSAILGYSVNLQTLEVGQYIILNVFIGSVLGASLWLFHDDKSDKSKFRRDS